MVSNDHVEQFLATLADRDPDGKYLEDSLLGLIPRPRHPFNQYLDGWLSTIGPLLKQSFGRDCDDVERTSNAAVYLLQSEYRMGVEWVRLNMGQDVAKHYEGEAEDLVQTIRKVGADIFFLGELSMSTYLPSRWLLCRNSKCDTK